MVLFHLHFLGTVQAITLGMTVKESGNTTSFLHHGLEKRPRGTVKMLFMEMCLAFPPSIFFLMKTI